ncbi:MAG: UDP-glucose/GDP-mannose dehydrogenase family protein [Lentisphaerae bacterium]|nr:UDP-glucose/GDP-mannose dehydrogenase family protein [Lentisphaerota bacterium]
MQKKIGVVGLWHLGCVLCAAWRRMGHSVVGFDHQPDRVARLQRGEPPLFEPGLSEAIQDGLRNGALSFSTRIEDLRDCDFVFLAYDTPVLDDDSSDTSILSRSVRELAPIMKNQAVLIVTSQSPAGFCRQLRQQLQAVNRTLDLAVSPENLKLGEAIACYLTPGRIILGTASADTQAQCTDLFAAIPGDILAMSLESAEMVKHGINSFLASSIVFTNQLSDLCETSGARIDDVIRGMKTDPRIGPKAYLAPGIGFSGGTLGRDLQVLAAQNHIHHGQATLFELVHGFNEERKNHIVERALRLLGAVKGNTIGVLGVTYKPGTSTIRRSRPLEMVRQLLDRRVRVKVFDPRADFSELPGTPPFEIAAGALDAARETDLLLLLTEWPEFRALPWAEIAPLMNHPNFFDTKNFLDENAMIAAGFRYHSIGRPS